MKRAVVFLVIAAAASAAYTYYYTDNLTSINPANWTQNGSLTATAGPIPRAVR
jgi:hypothetical protein